MVAYRILHVEDSPDDAELIRLALSRAGMSVAITRVDAEPEFRQVLEAATPDIILCDYDMPNFSAERALAIMGEKQLDLPFVVVSNHIGQNAAVIAMQHGASDYLSKRDLGRLGKAIEAAVDRARARLERARAESALRTSEAMKRGILESLASRIALLDPDGRILAVNRAWADFDTSRIAAGFLGAKTGANYLEMLDDAAAKGSSFAREGAEQLRAVIRRERQFASMDYRLDVGGSPSWYLARVTPLEDSEGGVVVSHEDITDRMTAHVALENAHRQLQTLSQRVLTIQEEERRTISRELHDDVGQTLAALKIGLLRLSQDEVLAKSKLLADCVEAADSTIGRLRDIAQDLRPPQLDTLGLEDALRWLVERQKRATGIEMDCRCSGLEESRLPSSIESASFRIAQEAINNATRHANAKTITVLADRAGRLLKLTVRDDGTGFSDEAAPERALKAGSIGLVGMKERAELAGGRLKVRSTMGAGTTVTAIFPLEDDGP